MNDGLSLLSGWIPVLYAPMLQLPATWPLFAYPPPPKKAARKMCQKEPSLELFSETKVTARAYDDAVGGQVGKRCTARGIVAQTWRADLELRRIHQSDKNDKKPRMDGDLFLRQLCRQSRCPAGYRTSCAIGGVAVSHAPAAEV